MYIYIKIRNIHMSILYIYIYLYTHIWDRNIFYYMEMFLFWVCSCFFDKNPPFGCSLPGCRRSESCSFWWWWGRYIHAGCKNGTGAGFFRSRSLGVHPNQDENDGFGIWFSMISLFQGARILRFPALFSTGGVCKKIPTWDSRKLLKLQSYETPGFDQIRWTATSKCKRPATCCFFFFWKEGSVELQPKKGGLTFKKGGIIFCRAICGIAIMGGFAVKFHAKFDLQFS